MSGLVAWFTGLPASGKSTLAARVRERLGRGILLDSDAVRDALGAADYKNRDDFYSVLARLAAMLARDDQVVLVAATAPRRAHRDSARAIAPQFVEIHVRTPLAECERRDPKGLYALARAGQVHALPGVGAPYEPPLAPDAVADGAEDAPAIAALIEARYAAGRVRST